MLQDKTRLIANGNFNAECHVKMALWTDIIITVYT